MGKLFGSTLKKDGIASGNNKDKTASAAPLFSDKSEKKVSNIKDLVVKGRQFLSHSEEIKDTPLPVSELSSFEVKEFLRERIGHLSIEGTINEMYSNIKNMEVQLQKVLDINSSLENDLKSSKSSMLKVGKENESLKEKLNRIEEEGPLRSELSREVKQLVEEQHKARENVQDIRREKESLSAKMDQKIQEVVKLCEEKDDALKEAIYLQSKTDDLVGKIRDYEEQISELRGENLYCRDKVKSQEEEISDLVEERNAIQLELKECKEAFDEIYEALIDTKIKTKKFFYKEMGE